MKIAFITFAMILSLAAQPALVDKAETQPNLAGRRIISDL